MTSHIAHQLMTRKSVILSQDTSLLDAVKRLSQSRVPEAPVVDAEGRLLGMLNLRDCMQTVVHSAYHGQAGARRVVDFISHDVEAIEGSSSLMDVAQVFATSAHGCCPVLEHGIVVGIVTRYDVINALLELSFPTRGQKPVRAHRERPSRPERERRPIFGAPWGFPTAMPGASIG